MLSPNKSHQIGNGRSRNGAAVATERFLVSMRKQNSWFRGNGKGLSLGHLGQFWYGMITLEKGLEIEWKSASFLVMYRSCDGIGLNQNDQLLTKQMLFPDSAILIWQGDPCTMDKLEKNCQPLKFSYAISSTYMSTLNNASFDIFLIHIG